MPSGQPPASGLGSCGEPLLVPSPRIRLVIRALFEPGGQSAQLLPRNDLRCQGGFLTLVQFLRTNSCLPCYCHSPNRLSINDMDRRGFQQDGRWKLGSNYGTACWIPVRILRKVDGLPARTPKLLLMQTFAPTAFWRAGSRQRA
jgi:hypothetical protein